ncbi:response regulator [candidate division WOR-3 bacterium]|jgi:PAS domain S-box-containing protein|nr:response regulator [candidate division WOR-3 bacterium]
MLINNVIENCKSILAKSGFGIYIFKEQDGIIYINKKFTEITDVKFEDIKGFGFLEYLKEEYKSNMIEYTNIAIEGKVEDLPFPYKIAMNSPVAGDKYILLYGNPYIDDNNIRFIIGFIVDITGSVKWDKETEKIKYNIEFSRQQSELLDQFNNLLTGIIGYASLLKVKFTGNREEWKYLEKIYNAATDASKMIEVIFNKINFETFENVSNIKGKALIVDDNKFSLSSMKDILEYLKYGVIGFTSENLTEKTLNIINDINIIFVNAIIPGVYTFGYISDILNIKPDLPVILMAYNEDLQNIKEIMDIHKTMFLKKPFTIESILSVLKSINKENI